MERDGLRAAIQRIDGLSSPSASLDRILELAADCESDVSQLTAAIEADPAITAHVLRLSNSAYFGVAKEVTTLARAVVVIGWQNVLGLATCAALAPLFRSPDPRLDGSALWLHSCATAQAARQLAVPAGFDPSLAHVAGLLHDLGAAVLSKVLGAPYAQVIERVRTQGLSLEAAERELLGVDHGWAAGVAFERWSLPAGLVTAVACHHAPETDPSGLATLVALANRLAADAGYPGPSGRPDETAPLAAWLAALKLDEAQLQRVAEELDHKRGLIELGAGGAP
jgi:HD-like signal output (HDOD) protein